MTVPQSYSCALCVMDVPDANVLMHHLALRLSRATCDWIGAF